MRHYQGQASCSELWRPAFLSPLVACWVRIVWGYRVLQNPKSRAPLRQRHLLTCAPNSHVSRRDLIFHLSHALYSGSNCMHLQSCFVLLKIQEWYFERGPRKHQRNYESPFTIGILVQFGLVWLYTDSYSAPIQHNQKSVVVCSRPARSARFTTFGPRSEIRFSRETRITSYEMRRRPNDLRILTMLL